MRQFWHKYRRMLLKVGVELTGILLLGAFVLAVATMPPLEVTRSKTNFVGYEFRLSTFRWKQNIGNYWQTVSQGSLGKDRKGDPVAPLVAKRLGGSLVLLGLAATLAISLGVIKGFWDFNSLRKRYFTIGPMLTGAASAVPDFWLVIMLQIFASWCWRKFNITWFNTVYDDREPLASLVFPVIALSLIPMAHVARITATAMSNIYDREFIRTARSKGLHEFLVIYKHALRNAVVQILDGMPGVLAIMLSNMLVVEYLFSYPGLTLLLLDAVKPPANLRMSPSAQYTDISVVVASGLAMGLIFSTVYLAIQFMRKLSDPRLKGREAA